MTNGGLVADREHIIEKTGDLWEALRGERVFITGGTGFVGSWLLEAFSAANAALHLKARAVVLTRDPSRLRKCFPHLAEDDSISCHVGDATTFVGPSGGFSFVVHAATEPSFVADRTRPLGVLGLDFQASRRVLDFASTSGVRRLLFTSSGAVYGQSPGSEPTSENWHGAPDPLQAASAYGESKRLSEYALASYGRAYGFDAIVARLFAFVGPGLPLDRGYAVGNFIADALAAKPIAVAGDGTARRSYLYAADLAIWLWTMLLRGEAGRAYNVGSPHAVSIEQLARTVASTVAPSSAVTIAGKAQPGAAPSYYVPDVERARTELGLHAWIGLPEALARTYAYHLTTVGRPTSR